MGKSSYLRVEPRFDAGDVSFPKSITRSSSLQFFAAVASNLHRDSGSEEQKILESAVQKCIDNEIEKPPAYFTALPSQPQIPFHGQFGVVSSSITTPSASTLVSRSTSRSSGTDSLPITPANELPTLLDGTDSRQGPASQVAPAFHKNPSLHGASAIGNTEVHPSQMQMVQLGYLDRPCHRQQTPCYATPSPDAQDELFPNGFIEELFAEGEAAKRLVELQQDLPKKKVSLRP